MVVNPKGILLFSRVDLTKMGRLFTTSTAPQAFSILHDRNKSETSDVMSPLEKRKSESIKKCDERTTFETL